MEGECGRVVELEAAHWPELYRLMLARRFPNVPDSFEVAQPYFASARLYGMFEGSGLAVGFVFGPPEDGIAFFDVVCAAEAHGKWAARPVLRRLAELAFVEMKLRCLWVQAHHKEALKAALQAGFVPATGLGVAHPVLAMTPLAARRLLNGREKRDGFIVQSEGADAAEPAADHGAGRN